MSCSFLTIVGRICAAICGGDEWTWSSTSITALKQCNKHTKHHNKSLKFSGDETWQECVSQKATNLLEMTICLAVQKFRTVEMHAFHMGNVYKCELFTIARFVTFRPV